MCGATATKSSLENHAFSFLTLKFVPKRPKDINFLWQMRQKKHSSIERNHDLSTIRNCEALATKTKNSNVASDSIVNKFSFPCRLRSLLLRNFRYCYHNHLHFFRYRYPVCTEQKLKGETVPQLSHQRIPSNVTEKLAHKLFHV